MQVSIEKFASRYHLFCEYDRAMLKFFRTIPGRFYDPKLRVWSFSNTTFEPMMQYFKLRDITVDEVTEDVILYHTDDKFLIKFKVWFSDGDALKALEGMEYDNETKLFIMPLTQEAILIDFLEKNKLTFVNRFILSRTFNFFSFVYNKIIIKKKFVVRF